MPKGKCLLVCENNMAQHPETSFHRLDAVEENQTNSYAWNSLIQNLTKEDLEKLKCIFESKLSDDGKKLGLDRTQFMDSIRLICDNSEYAMQSVMLFDRISEKQKITISWEEFLDFLLLNMYPDIERKLTLTVTSMETVSHGKNDSIAKICVIETKNYFCYAIILKYGKVGLYDGNLNFLTSYHAILTREDISSPEDERRKRNRSITDAIFCSDILMFLMVNTARSIVIYEASNLKHVPYWLILSTPNIIQCISYKSYKVSEKGESILFGGDDNGGLVSFIFLQPKNGLLKRKRTDDVTIFYWEDFLNQKNYVQVNQYKNIHQNYIKKIEYYPEIDSLGTCSRYAESSVIIKHVGNKRKSNVFKMNRGTSCFALSVVHKILLTGSDDGIIRIWNAVLTSKPVAILSKHHCDVLDIKILENENLFLSCSKDGILILWDLKEQSCMQTIRLKFPTFKVKGKLIEWSLECIYPGPKRKSPDHKDTKDTDLTNCFGIQDFTEVKKEDKSARTKSKPDIWERSNLLVICCNYVAKIRMDFNDPNLEYNSSFPILPPPPLQSSVLIPSDWRFEAENESNSGRKDDPDKCDMKLKEKVEDLKFILENDLSKEMTSKSEINYKIAVLETKKSKMMEKVTQGAPYLALDIHEINELKLSEDISLPKSKKSERIFLKIKSLLDDASSRNQIFSSISDSRSRSSGRSSLVEFPL